jgi:hypothetical protein
MDPVDRGGATRGAPVAHLRPKEIMREGRRAVI